MPGLTRLALSRLLYFLLFASVRMFSLSCCILPVFSPACLLTLRFNDLGWPLVDYWTELYKYWLPDCLKCYLPLAFFLI